MGLENSKTIDAIGTDKATGTIVLTILDSWNWSDVDAHLRALQAKLNTYLDYVASGKILEDYPQAASFPLRLDIVFRFDIHSAASQLLVEAHKVVAELGFTLTAQKIELKPPQSAPVDPPAGP